MQEICDGAFADSALRSIVLPSNAKRIGKEAFQNTENLLSIFIPPSVEEIGQWAFRESALETIEFEEGSKLKKIGDRAFENSALRSIVLPASLEEIGNRAFFGCSIHRKTDPHASVS